MGYLLIGLLGYLSLFYIPRVIITINPKVKKILYSIAIIIFIALLAGTLIAYGRGYRFNFGQKAISSTGILSATSSPDGASIWIDGKLTSATNGSISLPPAWYDLHITKEGYQNWTKRIRIQGEVVTRIDALLIPNNPSLRVLTTSGILSSSLSPTKTRLAYIIPQDDATVSSTLKSRIGVWVFDLRNGPLGGTSDPKQVLKSTEATVDWNNSLILWSPDEKQLILETKSSDTKSDKIVSALEIFLDNSNTPPIPVTSTLDSILADWNDTNSLKLNQSLAALPPLLTGFLTNSADEIQFSPDNNKVLYIATASATLAPVITPPIIGSNPTVEIRTVTPGKYYVYDVKEDKNFEIVSQAAVANGPIPFWYPDSKRIVMVENKSITITDYDGTNVRTIYSGPFVENIVYPWTSSGQLVILTNFNKPASLPDLYEIDIR